MHVMCVRKQRSGNCLQRGAQGIDQHHYSTAEILSLEKENSLDELGKSSV